MRESGQISASPTANSNRHLWCNGDLASTGDAATKLQIARAAAVAKTFDKQLQRDIVDATDGITSARNPASAYTHRIEESHNHSHAEAHNCTRVTPNCWEP